MCLYKTKDCSLLHRKVICIIQRMINTVKVKSDFCPSMRILNRPRSKKSKFTNLQLSLKNYVYEFTFSIYWCDSSEFWKLVTKQKEIFLCDWKGSYQRHKIPTTFFWVCFVLPLCCTFPFFWILENVLQILSVVCI